MIEEALYARLVTDPGVHSLVSSRVYHTMARQGSTMPFVVLSRVTMVREYTLSGPDGLPEAMVQVDCIGSTSASTEAVREAVRLALDGTSWVSGKYRVAYAMLEDDRDLTESPFDGSDKPVFRFSLDVRLRFFEETPV